MKSAAKALIFDADGQLLVLRRSRTHPLYALHLDFPGGELEDYEKPEHAAVRETFEETGLDISKNALELVHQHKIIEGVSHLLYSVQLADKVPAVTLSWEHDSYQWLSAEALLALPLPPNVDRFYKTATLYLAETVSDDNEDSIALAAV